MRNYRCLSVGTFSSGPFQLVPLRNEDRYAIMQWRNEQIYHLRQSKPLTKEDQDNYFDNVVSALFGQENPGQLLFSFLENGKCIGYGGLVHINWTDRNAEVSFIMNTELEKERFDELWSAYLILLEEIAFKELKLHKIFTYAFDIRPHLYAVLEKSGFAQDARLSGHCFFDGQFRDVLIHSKFRDHETVYLRPTASSDADRLFEWSNDPQVRQNSLSTEPILYENHLKWLDSQLNNAGSHLFILTDGLEDLGQIRISFKNELWEIGYSIASAHRGKKLGKVIVSLLLEKFPFYSYRAIVKNDNPASMKVFENLGFNIAERDETITVFVKNQEV